MAEHGTGSVPRGRERERDRRSVRGQAAMIRTSLTAEAHAAIAETLPVGSVAAVSY
jgi:hypothetical protein